uniref:Uncharacterized protein n=1 Tax=viral metagenome TaxID=1070528 RepID=A0A6C0FC23_9ZZZZ
MKLYIFIFIEVIFLMMVGLIIYHAEKTRNLQLSLGFNKIIFIIATIKLVWFVWAFNKNMNMCNFAKEIYC